MKALKCILIGLLIGTPATALPEEKLAENFRQVCGKLAESATAANTMTVQGRDGWMFLAGELRHLAAGEFWGEAARTASKASNPEWCDPLPAILDFKAALERAGIELLIVPVPPKAVVYPEMLNGEPIATTESQPPRLDLFHQQFYQLLREKGVLVLDLCPAYIAARLDKSGTPYCKQDSHWSGRGCEIAARQIVEAVKDRPWLKVATKQTFDSEVRQTEINGDLWNAAASPKPPKEKLMLRYIGKNEGGMLQTTEPDRNSPVILLGDSHTLVFHDGEDMHARGAGLADQLALEFGFPVDLIGVRGSGATPARINLYRRIQGNADYLENKKLLIWCFTAREFTEAASGWRKVPVAKSGVGKQPD